MKLLRSNSMKDLPDHRIRNFREELPGVVAVEVEGAVGVAGAGEDAEEDTIETEIEITDTTSPHRASGYQQTSPFIPLATREALLDLGTTHQAVTHGLQQAQSMDRTRVQIHIQAQARLTQDQIQDMAVLQIHMPAALQISQAHIHKTLNSTPTPKATPIPMQEAHINKEVLINTEADMMLVITLGSYPPLWAPFPNKNNDTSLT